MGNAFLTIVCPLAGNVLGIIMLLSPIPAVWQCRKNRTLGDINALPYPFTALNCFGWVVYGLVMNNAWISPANIIGCCAGMAFTLVAVQLADRKTADIIVVIMMVSVVYFGILGMLTVFAGLTLGQQQQLWGLQSVIVLMLFYAVPLSSMWEVIRSRNAISIYMPLACAAIANGTMWTLYGAFGTHDLNLVIPNAFGALLGCLQLGLRLHFGARPSTSPAAAPSGAPAANGHGHGKAADHWRLSIPAEDAGGLQLGGREGSMSGVRLLAPTQFDAGDTQPAAAQVFRQELGGDGQAGNGPQAAGMQAGQGYVNGTVRRTQT